MGSPTSNPKVNISLLPAAVVDTFRDRTNLIVGQKGATGTASDKVLVQDVHTLTEAQLQAQFGTGELYWRIIEWRSGAGVSDGGPVPALDVIPANANGSGVAATSAIQVTGTTTAQATFQVSVVDEERFTASVTVASGSANTVVAAAINTALGQLTNAPFSAGVSTDTVTITAADVGTVGNYYGLKVTGTVPGVSFTITPWSGGLNDPTLTDVLDPIDGRRESGVSWPEYWQSGLAAAVSEFDDRFNASNQILDGVIFHGRSATFANAKSAVTSENSQSLVVMGNNLQTNGPVILKPADWVASYFMGARARRLTTGAQIADVVVTTSGALDAIGGPALASLPYFNTPLPNVPVTLPADLYSAVEQGELEEEGFAVYGVNTASNGMIMGPVVTTYKTDGAGNPNTSFKYLNYVDTGSAAREIFFNTFKSVYVQSRLTEGDLVPLRSIENEASIREQCAQIYRFLANLTLVQAGTTAENYFKNNLTVDISLATRTVTLTAKLPIVTQIGVINFPIQLSFDTSGSPVLTA